MRTSPPSAKIVVEKHPEGIVGYSYSKSNSHGVDSQSQASANLSFVNADHFAILQ